MSSANSAFDRWPGIRTGKVQLWWSSWAAQMQAAGTLLVIALSLSACMGTPAALSTETNGMPDGAGPLAQARALPRAQPCVQRTDLPRESYWTRQPEVAFDPSDYVAHFHHMEPYYDVPGELGFIAEGERYGFEALSFIVAETQPSGGPPLHVHDTEEAHVLLEGDVEYLIGEKRFMAKGPYIARVPAGVPHAFANRGPCSFNIIAVFPGKKLSYKELGPNPLVRSK